LRREERIARAVLAATNIAPIVLLPATREMTRRVQARLGRRRRVGVTFRGKFAGHDVTLVRSGIGAPSAEAKMVACLGLGAQVFLRIDICGGLKDGMEVGDAFVAGAAVPLDGTSAALSATAPVAAAAALLSSARKAVRRRPPTVAVHDGVVVTVDTFFHQTPAMWQTWAAHGDAVDMETSIIYNLAARAGADALAIMAVSDLPLVGINPFNGVRYPYGKLFTGMDAAADLAAAVIRDIS